MDKDSQSYFKLVKEFLTWYVATEDKVCEELKLVRPSERLDYQGLISWSLCEVDTFARKKAVITDKARTLSGRGVSEQNLRNIWLGFFMSPRFSCITPPQDFGDWSPIFPPEQD